MADALRWSSLLGRFWQPEHLMSAASLAGFVFWRMTAKKVKANMADAMLRASRFWVVFRLPEIIVFSPIYLTARCFHFWDGRGDDGRLAALRSPRFMLQALSPCISWRLCRGEGGLMVGLAPRSPSKMLDGRSEWRSFSGLPLLRGFKRNSAACVLACFFSRCARLFLCCLCRRSCIRF